MARFKDCRMERSRMEGARMNPFAISTCARCGLRTEAEHNCRPLPCGHIGLMRTYRADGSSYCAACRRKADKARYGDLVEAVRLLTGSPFLWHNIQKNHPTICGAIERGMREVGR